MKILFLLFTGSMRWLQTSRMNPQSSSPVIHLFLLNCATPLTSQHANIPGRVSHISHKSFYQIIFSLSKEKGILDGFQKRKVGTKDIPPTSAFCRGAVTPSLIHLFIQFNKHLLSVNKLFIILYPSSY